MGGCFARKPEEAKEKIFTYQNLQKQVMTCPNPCMVPGSLLQDHIHNYNTADGFFTVYTGGTHIFSNLDIGTEVSTLTISLHDDPEGWVLDLLDSSHSFQVLGKTTKTNKTESTVSPQWVIESTVKYGTWGADRDIEEIFLHEGTKFKGSWVAPRNLNAESSGEHLPTPMETYRVSAVAVPANSLKGLSHSTVRAQEEKLLETLTMIKVYNESILGGVMPFKGNTFTYQDPDTLGLKFQNDSGTLEPFTYCLGPLTAPIFGMIVSIGIEKPWLFKQFIDAEKAAVQVPNTTGGSSNTNPASSVQTLKTLHNTFSVFPIVVCAQGIWNIIPTASLLPYVQSSDYPLLTQSLQQEYWLTLLEKALLISVSRPEHLTRRLKNLGYLFHEITGVPYKEIWIKKVFGQFSSSLEILLDHILEKGYSCSLTIDGNYNPLQDMPGSQATPTLVKGVAYHLLRSVPLKTGQKLYCLRNPWKPQHTPQEFFLSTKMAEMSLNLRAPEYRGCVFASSQELLEHFDVLFCGLTDPRGVQYTMKGHPTKMATAAGSTGDTQPCYFFELSVKAEGLQDFYLQLCQEEVYMPHPQQIHKNFHTLGMFVLSSRGTTVDGLTEREMSIKRMPSMTATFHGGTTARGEAGPGDGARIIEQWMGSGRDCWKRLTLGTGTYQILVYSASSYGADGALLGGDQLNGKTQSPSINLNLYTTSTAKVKLVSMTSAHFLRKTGISTSPEQSSLFSIRAFLKSALALSSSAHSLPEIPLSGPLPIKRTPLILTSSPITKLYYTNTSESDTFTLSVTVQELGTALSSSNTQLEGQQGNLTTPSTWSTILSPNQTIWLGMLHTTLSTHLKLTETITFSSSSHPSLPTPLTPNPSHP